MPGQNPNPRRGKWRRELWPLYKESGALTRHLENQTFTHNFHTEPGAPRIISFQIPSSSHFQLQGGGSGRGWVESLEKTLMLGGIGGRRRRG